MHMCVALCMTEAVCAFRLQMQMSQGKSRNQTDLYKCVCPPCFFELEEGGKTSCVPKGNLDYCDLPSGVYSNPGTAGGCSGRVTLLAMQPSCLAACCRGTLSVCAETSKAGVSSMGVVCGV